MALAKYFSKDLLALKLVLSEGSLEKFGQLLESNIIEIAFDSEALNAEGKATIDLLIRLVSRLYPRIKITHIDKPGSKHVEHLQTLASSINANIEIVEHAATYTIVIGNTALNDRNHKVYAGSGNWCAKLSSKAPVGTLNGDNPFAGGTAACLAASNVFRHVFREFITKELDDEASINLMELNASSKVQITPPKSMEIDFGAVHLVGLGAIGNGFLWALGLLKDARGLLTVIDHETVSLSNLQRYICTLEGDVGKNKTDLATEILKGSAIQCFPNRATWAEYIASNNPKLDIVVAAVDSAKDRIAIQSSLPHLIINAYTETNIIGITRHLNFGNTACLTCGFVPEIKLKDYSQEVADNLGIPSLENQVRHYIYYNFPVDDNLISWISQGTQISLEKLEQFRGMPFSNFYSDAVCGGLLLTLTDSPIVQSSMEAPLAFQSAMAGILLASELFLVRSGIRTSAFPNSTQIYPLLKNSIGNPYTTDLTRDQTMRCICNDEDFKKVFSQKWASHGLN